MAKIFQVEKTINGKKYVFQHNGLTAFLKATDSCYIDGTSNRSTEKFTKYLFENVIIEPKGLSADDFDTIDDLNEVTLFATDVLQGKHKDLAVETGTKK
ncbi:MAG: hypothetical protein IJL89_04810 [Firmicutes bacterium]|nr:hypothetical protein [Bacillota bacterium]